MPEAGQVSFTRQQEPLGLGHAVWCARELVGDEPFAVLLPDMIMQANPAAWRRWSRSTTRPAATSSRSASATPRETDQLRHRRRRRAGRLRRQRLPHHRHGREAGSPTEAPSNLYINGRYILQPQIFDLLARQQRGAGNEIQLTDAMMPLADDPAFLRLPLQRPHLRLRRQARLPRRQRRLWRWSAPTSPTTSPGDPRPARRVTSGRRPLALQPQLDAERVRLVGVAGGRARQPCRGHSRR